MFLDGWKAHEKTNILVYRTRVSTYDDRFVQTYAFLESVGKFAEIPIFFHRIGTTLQLLPSYKSPSHISTRL